MDIGYWIRTFQFTIYGQRFTRVYYIRHGLFRWNIHKLFTGIIFNYMDTYYFWSWSYILLQVDITSTGHYYKTILINGSISSTCYIQVILTRHLLRLMSPSFFDVCIYFGKRYAPIYITNYASSVRMTIFLLMTHVCHIVYCNMLLCIVCYCMYVIGYSCSNSYSVQLTP